MATQPKDMRSSARRHFYHADAYVLRADLEQPVPSEIKSQGLVELSEDGKYNK